MIYLLISRSSEISGSVRVEAGTPLRIEVSDGEDGKHPVIGFETIALAEEFIDRKGISKDEYKLILKDRGHSERYDSHPIYLVESKNQLDEMEKDTEGYDYNKHIFTNA